MNPEANGPVMHMYMTAPPTMSVTRPDQRWIAAITVTAPGGIRFVQS